MNKIPAVTWEIYIFYFIEPSMIDAFKTFSRRFEYTLFKQEGVVFMLIAVDHGNKQIKLPEERIFTSGLRESDTLPPFGEDIMQYKGKYYTLSEKRIPFMRDKTVDDRFYILSLFAIAFYIEDTGQYETDVIPVQLLVGLPPAHFGSQHKRFERYFTRSVEEFEFHGKRFSISIEKATAFPQAFAAAMPVYNHISTLPKVMVIDIGGFTADYLLIRNGQTDLTVCDSLENGVIILYNQITARVNSDLDVLLDEADIDNILKCKPNDFGDDVKRIVNDTAQMFISDLFGKLRERAIDLRSGKTVFVGGGSMLLREQIELSGKVASPIFVDKISANAKGFEIFHRVYTARGSSV